MKRWASFKPTRATWIGAGLFGICAGLYLGKFTNLQAWPVISMLAILSVVAYKTKLKYVVLLLCVVAGCCTGLLRGQQFAMRVERYNKYFGELVSVTGKVSDDAGYDKNKLTEFHLKDVKINGASLPGRVRIRALSAIGASRGDTIEAQGTLRQTLGTSRQGSISYAQVTVLQNNTSWAESLRARFFTSIYSSLPEPQASLGLGYLVGVRTALPQEFALVLSAVGLTHIVAVSGYNLTILVQFVKRIFEKVSAYQTVLFSVLLISGFLVMTGWSPSILRAAIISGFSLLAWYYGRSFQPLIIILIGAALTGFVNPLYIWGDVGWYLSFLAFTGVLLVAPLILFFLGPKFAKNFLLLILLETLSAQLLTIPYIAYIFGRISVISPLANMLIVPMIPISMLLVFVTGVVGMFSPALALWVAVPARLIMTLTVWVVQKLGSVPWAQRTIELSLVHVIALYMIMAITIVLGWLVYRRRTTCGHEEAIDWNLL
ncbi:ComEC/Rec2 family competence protein [Candidatus Saccharibacteria bacterium]|nr:ComEC/Rec2 family competence protein [Candidatus Saccharibacteria bacterium]